MKMSGIKSVGSGEESAPSPFIERLSNFHQRSLSCYYCRSFPKRYIMVLMCCLAFFIVAWMRANFAVIIFHILTQQNEERAVQFPASLNWTWEEIDIMVSSFDWAFACGQIPGSLLALSFSPHKLMALFLSASSIFHLLIPVVLNQQATVIIVVNFLHGFVTAPLFSSCIGLWREWAPSNERTQIVTLAFSGLYLRSVAAFPLSLYEIQTIGVTGCCFSSGVSGIIWSYLWYTLTYESPSVDRYISESERLYLEEKISPESKAHISIKSIPVKSIVTSFPMIALCIVFFCSEYAFVMADVAFAFLHAKASTVTPTVMVHMAMGVPYITYIILIPSSGFFAEFLIRKFSGNVTLIRKIFCCGALTLHALLLFVCFHPNTVIGLAFFNASFVILGLSVAGVMVNVMDLSSRYACIIMGITGTFHSLGSIAADVTIEEFGPSFHLKDYRIMFVIVSVLCLLAASAFSIFGSGEEQAWSSNTADSALGEPSQYYPETNSTENVPFVTDSPL